MTIRAERLARSMLYVPASRPDMIAKAARSEADAVCIDLEDAVAPDRKESSRANVVRALAELDFGPRTRIVRINGLDTEYAERDLADAIEPSCMAVDVLMLPKSRSAADLEYADRRLGEIESRAGMTRKIGMEAQVETAGGFVWLREIAASTPRLEALIFGMGDYAASMGMPLANIGEEDAHDAAYPGHRWHAVMHGIVAAARANGLRAIDGPFASFRDASGFERTCRIARALGYDGKQCIHPAQIAAANAAFSPGADEIAWARAVVSAYEKAAEQGRGAVAVNGKMVDAANVRMAMTTLRRQDAIEARAKELG